MRMKLLRDLPVASGKVCEEEKAGNDRAGEPWALVCIVVFEMWGSSFVAFFMNRECIKNLDYLARPVRAGGTIRGECMKPGIPHPLDG